MTDQSEPRVQSAPAPRIESGAGGYGEREVAPPSALPGEPVTERAAALSDGEWHRMHPASPLLKGGLALLAIIGAVIANLRERLVEIFVPQAGYGEEDPIDLVLENGLLGYALLAVLALLLVLVVGFYVSWRMHTFRITAEVVEVRSGVVFRTNRKARLDRIQGINIQRPFFARLFGAARLEVNQAGQDANVKLEYLASGAADDLRREILRLASGTREETAAAARGQAGSFVERRVDEFLAPELDPDAAEPESVVRMSVPRLIGSILLSGATIFVVIAVVSVVIVSVFAPDYVFGLFGLIPAALGIAGYAVQRFTKSLRYSIAGTPDGIRIGFGLLSTSNETLPPGRVHSVRVSQPLLWRAAGWWEIKVNRASHSSTKGAAGQQNTTILPVGDLGDVSRVLGLILPDFVGEEGRALLERGLISRGGDDGFVNSPRRAAPIRWFSWRRNGFALSAGAVLLRKGAIWRELVIVPAPRLQSVSMSQGPLLRAMRLGSVHLHTVAGPITAALGALGRDDAVSFFERVSAGTVAAAGSDATHRWRSADVATPAASTSEHAVAGPVAPSVAAGYGSAAPVAASSGRHAAVREAPDGSAIPDGSPAAGGPPTRDGG